MSSRFQDESGGARGVLRQKRFVGARVGAYAWSTRSGAFLPCKIFYNYLKRFHAINLLLQLTRRRLNSFHRHSWRSKSYHSVRTARLCSPARAADRALPAPRVVNFFLSETHQSRVCRAHLTAVSLLFALLGKLTSRNRNFTAAATTLRAGNKLDKFYRVHDSATKVFKTRKTC